MNKKTLVLLLLLFSTLNIFCQNKTHTLFDKDSIISVTNYSNKFHVIDSLVIKTGIKKLIITEKNVTPFYKKSTEELGVCPFATNICFFNNRLIAVSAILRSNFNTSFHIFFICRKSGELINIIKTESANKSVSFP